MCGIAGFVGRGERSQLGLMVEKVAHRGPDDGGFWVDSERRVFLGHRRLSIVDLACGDQPMATGDGSLVVTFNGEIYNHRALREELVARGHQFVTDHSDTEVLLHGYREWGEGLPLRLNGMFAFALWDRAHQRLFCARDRFGEKPFFYAQRGDFFAFGSELTALEVLPQLELRRSPRAIQKYMAYGYFPAPLTVYDDVFKLPGGCALTFDLASQRCEVKRYWSFKLEPFDEASPAREREWEEQLRELIERSVTAFAMRAGAKVKTFTIGFREKSFDESEVARRVALFLEADHAEKMFSINEAQVRIKEVIGDLDEPLGDASLMPTSLLAAFARQSVKVALGGDGADELFGGYDPFLALRNAAIYERMVPQPVHLAIHLLAGRLPVSHANMSFDFKVKRTLRGLKIRPALRLPVWMSGFDPDEAAQLFDDPLPLEELFSEAIEIWDECSGASVGDQALQYFTRLYLQNDILVKTDRASMRHGLEVRSPFLDYDLVDFVRRLPYNCKVRGKTTKWLLKRAMAPLLPADILHRRKKGFGVPIGAWMRRGAIAAGTEAPPAPIRRSYIRNAQGDHQSGKVDHRMLLWNCRVLEGWDAARRGA
jgi:asparagine synthase (glutamine-hydrolysing)